MEKCNAMSLAFYQKIGHKGLYSLCDKTGLLGNPDIAKLRPLIEHANYILECGPGWGRVIDGIRKINKTAEINAIEFNVLFIEKLKNKYKNDVNIVEGDFASSVVMGQFHKMDLILCLHFFSDGG